MSINLDDIKIDLTEDRPKSGMLHCGPNAAWVTITHVPTMMQARAFDDSQHRARALAMDALEYMVESSRLVRCQFHENVS